MFNIDNLSDEKDYEEMSIKSDVMRFEEIDFCNPTLVHRPPYKMRRSPIIATLADGEVTPVDIQKMMEAGMNVARFRMSTSTQNDKVRLLAKIEKATSVCCQKYGVTSWPIATCVELKTCIVKTGLLEEETDKITLTQDSEVILTNNVNQYDRCNEHIIFVDNHYLTQDVKVGTEISISQDEIYLKCIEIVNNNSIKCKVTKQGSLSNLCNVVARNVKHSRPYITEKDLTIIKFALKYQVDMVIINYVRHKDTLLKAKQHLGTKVRRPVILSGICTQQGLDNIDEVLKESDGIILARDFLPYELEASKKYRLPQIQKWVGAKCQQAGKPFFISGGVLVDTLLKGDISDHEISDVTNALLDGATGFIVKDCDNIDLSIHTIRILNDLCCSVEPLTHSKSDFWRIVNEVKMPANAAEVSVLSCVTVANQTNAKVIILPTVTGRTAKALLCMRPSCIVITVSTNQKTTRLLKTYRSVVPLIFTGTTASLRKWHHIVNARISFAVEYAVKRNWLDYGDTYVTLQRASDSSSFCDCVRIFTVTVSKKTLVECSDSD